MYGVGGPKGGKKEGDPGRVWEAVEGRKGRRLMTRPDSGKANGGGSCQL